MSGPADLTGSDAANRIAALLGRADGPIIVAIDGRSGTGKSTLAANWAASLAARFDAELSTRPGVAVVGGDDFYAGGSAETWDAMTPAQRADHCIDWRRQRPVLETLLRGEDASWHAFDWDADTWDSDRVPLAADLRVCPAAPLVILEGAYSARPELADLLSLRVLLDAPEAARRAQLLQREGSDFSAEWDARWASAEAHYFASVMPPSAFDLAVTR